MHVKNKQPYQTITLPKIPKVPGLTTEDEHTYLYWLMSHNYQGQGAVVEIGTWLGCSAGYLAAGLRDSDSKEILYCFDWFVLRTSEKTKAREQGLDLRALPDGTDTRFLVQQHLQAIYPHISLQKVIIEQFAWSNGSIEIVHLDAPKRWQDIAHILKVIQPFLIPGVSKIIVQDFCVPCAYALPLIFGLLSDSFEYLPISLAHSTMAVFVYRKAYKIDHHINIREWDTEHAITIWKRVIKAYHWNESHIKLLTIALAYYLYDTDEKELAAQFLKGVE